jgi:hypothetical protein
MNHPQPAFPSATIGMARAAVRVHGVGLAACCHESSPRQGKLLGMEAFSTVDIN